MQHIRPDIFRLVVPLITVIRKKKPKIPNHLFCIFRFEALNNSTFNILSNNLCDVDDK